MAKKGRVITVDGTKMQGGGGSVRVPEGDYKAKVAKVETTKSQAGDPMLKLSYKITDGKQSGKVIIDRIVLTEKVLWKLRQLRDALGLKSPNKEFKVDLDKLEGGVVAITVIDGEPYKNRIKSEIADVLPIDSISEEDDDDKEDDDDDEDKDDDDDDELEDVDLDDEL